MAHGDVDAGELQKRGEQLRDFTRNVKVTQKSAWFMLHRIRYALQEKPDQARLHWRPVEVDETFIGGKLGNMHKSKRREMKETRNALYETGFMNKTVVMGFLDRKERRVRAQVIPNVRRDVLQDVILKQISPCLGGHPKAAT